MDATHLHLLLNHVPTVGFSIAIALFLLSLVVRSSDLKQAGLVLFVLIALATLPTYVTGNGAQVVVQENPDVSLTLIESHEGAAFLALILMELTGALAWLALWTLRRTARLSGGMTATLVVLSLATFAVTARAANIGGEISHGELRGAVEPTTFVGPLARTVGDFVRDEPWAWIASETVHFIGLSLLVGIVLLINLRMLGVARQLSFSVLDRLLPWAMLGFAANTMTGMLFVAAAYGQYVNSAAFYWKLLFVVVAAVTTLYFTYDRAWLLEDGQDAPTLSKAAAGLSLALWVGVLYWGSMLPFIGTAF